jgi:hypothetical protein
MAEFPAPKEGLLLTCLVVSQGVERSRRFYADVLGGETVLDGAELLMRDPDGASHRSRPGSPRR